MLQTITHYFLHFIAIGAIAYWFDPKTWKRNWLILLSTMLVDLDHLIADPIFDADRCGIFYHPLHSEYAIAIYLLGALLLKLSILKLVFIGLLFHMFTDLIDCFWMFSNCADCYLSSEVYNRFH